MLTCRIPVPLRHLYTYTSRHLNLQENKIHTLGKSAFFPLQKLVTLSLHENKLTWINRTSDWEGLSSLKELNMDGNTIKYIDKDSWYPLKNLSKLILSNNELTKLDICPLNMLLQLDISYNKKSTS